jgi:hypothetical protein
MSVQRAGGPAGLWGRGGRGRHARRDRGKRVRFRQAVPVRRDRKDLRRQFRLAARAVTAERKAEAVAHLVRLSAERVPLSAVMPGTRDKERIAEFFDGTRLLVAARYGSSNLRLLAPGSIWSPVWLAQVRPSFTRRWFRLWFASDSQAGLLEVQALVTPAPAR